MTLPIKPTVLDFTTFKPQTQEFNNSGSTIIFFSDISGDLTLDFLAQTQVNLTIFFLPAQDLTPKTSKLIFNLAAGVQLDLYVANFTNYSLSDTFIFNLNAQKAGLKFYQAAINENSDDKKTLINPIHWTKNTFSQVKVFQVLKDESQGFLRCVSDIKKGSANAEAHQELRLTILDTRAKANSDPVLLIDENEVVASHANAIGMLDQDQIFYLLSRGLTELEAQKLIVSGYFAPIFQNVVWSALPPKFQAILEQFK